MQCLQPIVVMVNREPRKVPCGQCLHCRINRATQWALRIEHETDGTKDALFPTFTYSDVCVPKNVSKEHVQLFMKRLRKNTGEKFKYFISAEYAPETKRPHYHGILITKWMPKDRTYYKGSGDNTLWISEKLNAIWGWGYCPFGYGRWDSFRYCMKYIEKQLLEDWAKEGLEPTFSLKSQGLGKEFALNHKEQLEKGITRLGSRMPTPRYYRKIWEKEEEGPLSQRLRDIQERIRLGETKGEQFVRRENGNIQLARDYLARKNLRPDEHGV